MRRGRAVLVAVTVVVSACAGGTTAATPAHTSVPTSTSVRTPDATIASPAASGIQLDTTRAADDILLSVTSPVRRGATAGASAMTAPNAICTITVTYASGPSSAKGLEPKRTDGAGNVSWSWTVGTNTTPGAWPVQVSCTMASGQRTIAREMLTVE